MLLVQVDQQAELHIAGTSSTAFLKACQACSYDSPQPPPFVDNNVDAGIMHIP